MSVLYDQAREHRSLVIGTGNRSEALVGYTTLHGDAACDLAPIAGLYKDEIYALARELSLPRSIIEAAPSAGLWPGQSDEAELGLSYRELDPILRALADRRLTASETSVELGTDLTIVHRVERLMQESAFKRAPVPTGPSAIARR
jgi:NAD+ synthase